MHSCRIVLFTSLVWFLLDVAVLVYYSDSPSRTNSNEGGGGGGGDGVHPVLRDSGVHGGVQAHPAKREILDDSSLNHFLSSGDLTKQEVVFLFKCLKFFF